MSSNPPAFAGVQATPWLPADNTLLLANDDLGAAVGTQLLVAGTLYLLRATARSALTLSNAVFAMTTAGVGASSGSFAGAYSLAGTLLSGSADIGGLLTGATGSLPCPLTSPPQLAAGQQVDLALLVNLATTQPTMAKFSTPNAVFNLGLAAAGLRAAVNGTGLVALPGSITPASNTAVGAFPLFAGGS